MEPAPAARPDTLAAAGSGAPAGGQAPGGAAAALASVVDDVVRRVGGAGAWSAAERRDVLAGLDRAVDALSTARAAVLVAEREAGTWAGSGDRSFDAWRARTARSGPRSAAAQVRQADGLAAVPWASAAVTEGRITLEHAAAIARGADTPTRRAAADDPATQRDLLHLAERVDAGAFATSVARWAATVEPAALERDHESQRAERYLQVTGGARGTFLKGRLDSMAGHRLTVALESLSPRPTADDDRDAGQRCADALDALVARALDPQGGGAPGPGAHVTMILTAQTWAAARSARERRRSTGAGAGPGSPARDDAGVCAGGPGDGGGDGDGARGYPPATLEDGTPVPASELAAAMCDCEITRLVLDADGVPLDLGRSQRLFTAHQRRAVVARDRGCGWSGCPAPARWCQVHHIRWWERDEGPTSTENAVLLCSFHHHEVHRRDLAITRVLVGADAADEAAMRPPDRGDRAPETGRAPTTDPPGRAVPDTPALVRYVFQDRSGRVVSGPPAGPSSVGESAAVPSLPGPSAAGSLSVGASAAGSSSVGASAAVPSPPGPSAGRAVGRDTGRGDGVSRPRADHPPGVPAQRPRSGGGEVARGDPDDGLDLTRVTDPVTGMSVPAWLLGG